MEAKTANAPDRDFTAHDLAALRALVDKLAEAEGSSELSNETLVGVGRMLVRHGQRTIDNWT